MIGGAKGIGIGIDFGIPNQYCRATSKPYIEKDVLDSLRVVASAYGKSNNDADRSIVKNLVDASNPFIISNAAYEGMSGYNGYPVVFGANKTWANESNGYVTSITSNTIHITNVLNAGLALLYSYVKYNGNLQNIKEIPPFKIEIKGLEGRSKFIYKYLATSDATKDTNLYLGNGTHELPKSFLPTEALINNAVVGFSISPIEEGVTNFLSDITIKVLPEYEGAFVTDGIDDLITSTKTVQEMLGGSNELTIVSMVHQVKDSANNVSFTNYIRGSANGYFRNIVNNYDKTGIYGYTSSDLMGLSVVNNILGDKNDYTANGDNRDSIINGNFSVQGYSYNDGNNTGDFSSVAWYWTIIANKVLTTDQINQVIAYFNLDRTLNPDILCNTIKQGITNENHAEFGDKLIDFSGNGRDIQLNNIAWKGDSGIGKYEVDFLDSSIWNSSNSTITSSKIDCKNAISHIMLLYYSVGSKEYPDIPSFKVIKTGADIDYSYIDETGSPKSVKIVDGVNILPASHNTLYSGSGRFCGFGNPGMGNSVTITQIPSHAGGLCLDGINDFGKVTGMPVYKDYTVVTDREIFANTGAISSKNNPGAFVETAGNSVYSFGQGTSGLNFISTRSISYLSKYSYCGQSITAGAAEDGTDMWLGTIRDNDSRFFNGAIYSLMSFPYSMSEFLIERQLKKHKLGTLYPNMVEFRPVIKSNTSYDNIVFYYKNEKVENGTYLTVGSSIGMHIRLSSSPVNEIKSITVNGIPATFKFHDANNNIYQYDFNLTSKSPQKIDITIDEYIRYEDIVQPYPVIFQITDRNTNQRYNWGDKIKVGSSIRLSQGEKPNLLSGLYSIQSYEYEGETYSYNQLTNLNIILTKQSISLSCNKIWLLDNNEPKCILSPRLLRIPNSSYKILGYIPDISGHGNHGKINNSAYAEGSGVNEDGSYQFDGVDDFVTIPTIVGGKQVLMKVNWQSNIGDAILYDQRFNVYNYEFAIYNSNTDNYSENPHAYSSRNNGKTYIDGILNTYIKSAELQNVTHNITATNELSSGSIPASPIIGSNISHDNAFAQMTLYDFMLFDNISTDDKIKELNEYVGIEAKVELPPYYWDAYGKTNSDADKDTIQQRGIAVGDYDLTNTNFAYDKMSGFGGYTLGKFTNSWSLSNNSNSISIVARNPYDITLKKLGENRDWEFKTTELKIISNPVSVKFKSDKNIRLTCDYHYYTVGGNSEGAPLGITSKDLIANEDTIITISPISQENIDKYNIDINRGYYLIYFQLSLTLAVNEEVTIEMLPLYPNGLVYDGVTDYSNNNNIPTLTDFTVIAKRTWLEENTSDKPFIIKGDTLYPDGNQNAFLFEYGKLSTYSFGQNNKYDESVVPSLISWATPTSYNGTTSLVRGSAIDTVGIDIAHATKMVFYKLILYPKTISLLEINFLKNLMEKDEIIDLTNPIFIQ